MNVISKNKKQKPIVLKNLILKPSHRSETDILKQNDPLIHFNYSIPYYPKINIFETTNEFKLEVEAPGLDKKDFRVKVNNKILTVSAYKAEDDLQFKRKEYSFNTFSRSIWLPKNLVLDKLKASYLNGILHILIPKKLISTPETLNK